MKITDIILILLFVVAVTFGLVAMTTSTLNYNNLPNATDTFGRAVSPNVNNTYTTLVNTTTGVSNIDTGLILFVGVIAMIVIIACVYVALKNTTSRGGYRGG